MARGGRLGAKTCTAFRERPKNRKTSAREDWSLNYREVEYTVVQGIERQLWKWSFSLEGLFLKGQAATRAEAVAGAERAIDRVLTHKR